MDHKRTAYIELTLEELKFNLRREIAQHDEPSYLNSALYNRLIALFSEQLNGQDITYRNAQNACLDMSMAALMLNA